MTTMPKDMLIAKMFSQPNSRPVPSPADASETGRPVQGPGTGTSDSVPAVITDENGQPESPAQLSKDEFVVKADYLRKLGQGNPELGAKMLQNMLDQLMARSEPKVQKSQVSQGIGSLLGAK